MIKPQDQLSTASRFTISCSFILRNIHNQNGLLEKVLFKQQKKIQAQTTEKDEPDLGTHELSN